MIEILKNSLILFKQQSLIKIPIKKVKKIFNNFTLSSHNISESWYQKNQILFHYFRRKRLFNYLKTIDLEIMTKTQSHTHTQNLKKQQSSSVIQLWTIRK